MDRGSWTTIPDRKSLNLFFDQQKMRKSTKKEVNVYSGGSHIMTTLNSEFNIRPDNNCYANLHNNYAYNFPLKRQYVKLVIVTSMQEALIEISN